MDRLTLFGCQVSALPSHELAAATSDASNQNNIEQQTKTKTCNLTKDMKGILGPLAVMQPRDVFEMFRDLLAIPLETEAAAFHPNS